ncbi:hypothetical protein ACK2IE_22465 [Clostridioides difficile]
MIPKNDEKVKMEHKNLDYAKNSWDFKEIEEQKFMSEVISVARRMGLYITK